MGLDMPGIATDTPRMAKTSKTKQPRTEVVSLRVDDALRQALEDEVRRLDGLAPGLQHTVGDALRVLVHEALEHRRRK